ncbi:restriction endonuclease [Streptomyces sp. NPDC001744]|uniref:restriction endonuclease n=1 Tax=Streptomyces sp. NPDC001744 TaxID=3364606 RepID=UPI0036C76BE6
MRATGKNSATARRGPVAVGRDLVLAIGLTGICVGGLALFFKTAEAAESRGSGVPAAVLVALAALGALAVGLAMVRRSASAVRDRRARRPAGPGTVAGPYVPGVPDTAGAPGEPVVPDVGAEALDHAAVDADGFEHTVAALCARDGCTPVEVVGGAGDLGADVIATTVDGRRLVIQCKHYAETNRVGSQDLQRFGGTCFTVHGADVAVVVTTSSFTAPAAEYAATCGILCVDGEALTAWTDQTAPPPWDALPADPASLAEPA